MQYCSLLYMNSRSTNSHGGRTRRCSRRRPFIVRLRNPGYRFGEMCVYKLIASHLRRPMWRNYHAKFTQLITKILKLIVQTAVRTEIEYWHRHRQHSIAPSLLTSLPSGAEVLFQPIISGMQSNNEPNIWQLCFSVGHSAFWCIQHPTDASAIRCLRRINMSRNGRSCTYMHLQARSNR